MTPQLVFTCTFVPLLFLCVLGNDLARGKCIYWCIFILISVYLRVDSGMICPSCVDCPSAEKSPQCQLALTLCQLALNFCQLALSLCQLALSLCQLALNFCQLALSLFQLALIFCQLAPMR